MTDHQHRGENLTPDQARLHDAVLDVAGLDGSDCKDVLDASDATATDKAAVAEVLGGGGAGADYLTGTDQADERPPHLRGITDDQVDLYHRMIQQVAATGVDYWTTLRGLDAPAADKYAVGEALGDWPAQLEYGPQAGIDPYKGNVDMTTLGRGDQFIGPDGRTRYEVTTPASEHEHGWVDVRNLSMSDEEAAARLAEPGAVEAGCDPRDGFFAYSAATYVQPVASASTAQPATSAGISEAAELANPDTSVRRLIPEQAQAVYPLPRGERRDHDTNESAPDVDHPDRCDDSGPTPPVPGIEVDEHAPSLQAYTDVDGM